MAVCAFSSTATFGAANVALPLAGDSETLPKVIPSALSVIDVVGAATVTSMATLPSKLSLSACGTMETS